MKTYIGYSTDSNVRFNATSGGIGTSFLKWLFDKNMIETSISFVFNSNTLRYEPQIIHSFNDYRISGSIYQEIDLIGFIKSHLNEIKGVFACFALPCQARTIRKILEKAGYRSIIIGLTCSSQQTIDATKYLLSRKSITLKDVDYIQYRGNGWPSGIQIKTKNGQNLFINNNNSIWTQIFHSRLFIRQKCFKCQNTLNKYSDITLADPWLKDFMENEKIGKTLVFDYTEGKDKSLLELCCEDGYIILDTISESVAIASQRGTILRKESYKTSKLLVNFYFTLINNIHYRKVIFYSSIFFNIHLFVKKYFERYLLKINSRNKKNGN